MKKRFIAIVTICAMALTLILAGCGSKFTYDNADKYSKGGGSIENGTRVENVEITWIKGAVVVQYGAVEQITFSETGDKALSDDEEMRYWQDGETLSIMPCKSGVYSTGFRNKTLTLTLPEGEDLTRLEIKTVSASATVNEINVGNARMESVSGNVTLNDVDISDVEVDNVSGEFDASFISVNNLDIHNVSGDVSTVFKAGVPSLLEISTVSSNVQMTFLPVDFEITYATISGIFYCEYETTVTGNTYCRGTGGAIFRVETVSGNLSVYELK